MKLNKHTYIIPPSKKKDYGTLISKGTHADYAQSPIPPNPALRQVSLNDNNMPSFVSVHVPGVAGENSMIPIGKKEFHNRSTTPS